MAEVKYAHVEPLDYYLAQLKRGEATFIPHPAYYGNPDAFYVCFNMKIDKKGQVALYYFSSYPKRFSYRCFMYVKTKGMWLTELLPGSEYFTISDWKIIRWVDGKKYTILEPHVLPDVLPYDYIQHKTFKTYIKEKERKAILRDFFALLP